MATVRPFDVGDIGPVASLRRRMFRHSRWRSDEELSGYLRHVFFDNPWRDEELPSLVYEEKPGEVAGFLGIIPRPWRMRGQEVRGAVATQFMVAPECQSFAAWELLSRAFSGKQDLLLADAGNGLVHPLWERLGGATVRLYSLCWTRRLRPVRAAAGRLGQTRVSAAACRLARPVLDVMDATLARWGGSAYRQQPPSSSGEPLRVETMVEHLPQLAGPRTLRPSYDEASLRWLLDQVAAKWGESDLHGVLVRGSGGEVAGWFLYVGRQGAAAQVLQLIAGEGQHGAVVDHLIHHAWRNGATGLTGRLEPTCLADLASAGCTFHYNGPGMLVHSRSPAVLDRVLRGSSVMTGLEGEWWLDF